jgi:GYF domain 2
MKRDLYIVRGVTELGPLTEREVHELLRDGFLLPADLYWEDGMAKWAELGEFESAPSATRKSAGLVKLAKRQVSSVGRSAASRASDLTRKLQFLAGRGRNRLNRATTALLDSFVPQIQKLVSHQLVRRSATHVKQAVHDDEFMQKFFGAIYDCLPKPVCRFVPEKVFVQYCMERRFKMLGMDATQVEIQDSVKNPVTQTKV